jgi:Xaa-Pro aminopeptidase
MGSPTYGTMSVDWENRLDMVRLREQRLAKLKTELDRSSLGGLLTFDFHNIRYMTSTHIGTWAMDKMIRFAVLPRGGAPVLWDFGSAARHHQLHSPWLDAAHVALPANGHSHDHHKHYGARAGISTLRGAISPNAGRAQDVAKKVYDVLADHGLIGEPIGVDIIEPSVLFALQEIGPVVDGQQVFLEARRIKTIDEIVCSRRRPRWSMPYEQLYQFLQPGVKENECVGLVSKVLYDLGSEQVEGVNAISGERCSPHPHVFSDRVLRPGDPAFFDVLHSYMGYRTCYYRTFAVGSASRAQQEAYKICRNYMDHAIALVKPGATTADIVRVWPTAQEFGFPDEEAAFALQYGHGVGLSIWERPIFSRLTSIDQPEVLEEGMVFALETYWPASDGWGAARIEEELIVTADGAEVITVPAEDLLVAGRRYHDQRRAAELRDSQSYRNRSRTWFSVLGPSGHHRGEGAPS